jgi:hypothetical protein
MPYKLPILSEETQKGEYSKPTTMVIINDQEEILKRDIMWEKKNQQEEYLSEFPELLNKVNGKEIIEKRGLEGNALAHQTL